MGHNTASIALITWIRQQDFKLDYDTIKVHFRFLLINLLTHELTASF